MKNLILTIVLGIFLIGIVSAIYPGECDSFEFPIEGIVNLTIQDNTSSMKGFSYTQNEKIIEYCLGGSFAPGNFTLIFYTESEEVVIVQSSGGGGGGSFVNNNLLNGSGETILRNKYLLFRLDEIHRIQYMGMVDGYARFIIMSDPIEVKLKDGESQDVEIENQTVNIKVIKVYPEKVEIILSFPEDEEEVIKPGSMDDVEIIDSANINDLGLVNDTMKYFNISKEDRKSLFFVVLGLIIISLIVLFFVSYKKKNNFIEVN